MGVFTLFPYNLLYTEDGKEKRNRLGYRPLEDISVDYSPRLLANLGVRV